MFRADFTADVGKTFTLAGPEGKHAANVRRMRIGEAIQLSNGSGLRLRGTVSQVNPGQLEIDVQSCVQEAEPNLRVTLVQALAKGDRDELAIQAATELGIMKVVPWQAENSISRWEGAKISKSIERWQTIVGEAAKQALRAFEPKVLDLQNSKQLSDSTELPKRRLVLDPTSPESLVSQLPISGDVAILVGPEGGISPSELQVFEAAGFERVHLGSSILRTSTAGIAAVAALFAQSDSWR